MSKTVTPPLPRARRSSRARRSVVVVGIALMPVLAACGSGSSSADAGGSSASSPTQSASSGTTTCDYPDAPQGKTGNATKPPATPDVHGQVTVTMKTNIGTLVANLDADKAPCTVNSFVSLANQGYFDNSPCHRLTTVSIYVLQCGDPTGTGTGGPGYTIPDELSGTETYGPGTLAMAKTNDPNSGGSQFFIVYRDSTSALQPLYTVFGHLDAAGIKAVRKVAAKGSDNAFASGDGHPREAVTIQSVTTN